MISIFRTCALIHSQHHKKICVTASTFPRVEWMVLSLKKYTGNKQDEVGRVIYRQSKIEGFNILVLEQRKDVWSFIYIMRLKQTD